VNLLEVVRRTPVPGPWAEGEKIPFSALLAGTGFAAVEIFPSLVGEPDPSQRDFLAIVARKGPLPERRSR
jgi:hypothetical protein